jgi:hypothetical protein
VTPAPRARDVRFGCGEKDMAITRSNWRQASAAAGFLYHNATKSLLPVKH